MLAAAVAGLVESADLSLLPLFGLHAGLDERTALLLVTVFLAGNVALQLPIGLLADRFGRRLMLGVCAAASAIGPLLLPGVLDRPTLLWPLLFVWGGTLYAFYSQGVALLGEEFPERDLAGANTLFVMVYCVGGILGPSIGGYRDGSMAAPGPAGAAIDCGSKPAHAAQLRPPRARYSLTMTCRGTL
jgi:MFS family permease